jgi:hypothetical protein
VGEGGGREGSKLNNGCAQVDVCDSSAGFIAASATHTCAITFRTRPF